MPARRKREQNRERHMEASSLHGDLYIMSSICNASENRMHQDDVIGVISLVMLTPHFQLGWVPKRKYFVPI